MITFRALAIYAGIVTSVALASAWAAVALSRRAEQAEAEARAIARALLAVDRELDATKFFADAVITEASRIWVEKGGK